jgi:CRP/FNR family transcriptional regulator, cyclic AMP receptor protein
LTVIDQLGKTLLFGSLHEADLAAIASQMREVRYNGGQSIFARGDRGTDIFLVIEGRVRLSILTAEGRELSFNHAVAGEIFGEIAALDGGERSADATALVDTRMVVLPMSTLDKMMAAKPSLARAVIGFLCHRLRNVSDHLENVALFPIETRLARFLLHALGPAPAGKPAESQRLTLGMSQSELALLLGASRPKVNAALAMLESEGAVRRTGQDLVCDRAILSNLADA